jgi:hypothetical protein
VTVDVLAVAEAVGVLAVGAGGFSFARRFGSSSALLELERANGVLDRRVKELESENKTQAHRISELEAKTDVALALTPLLEALHRHEEHAERRASATLHVLDMIAQKLGPEVVG